MKTIQKNAFVSINLLKSALYSVEYNMLFLISKSFSRFVTPPKVETDKVLLKYLQNKVIEIHQEDAQNIIDGYYPKSVLIPKAPKNHLLKFPLLIADSLKISRRRKLNLKNDLDEQVQSESIPDYYKRNFHFQTDGYFSETSASLYEQQVEILFSGTAAPMRRSLIRLIKDKINKKIKDHDQRPLKILELGAGVGTSSIDFLQSFNIEKYFLTDPSDSYLNFAKKRIENKNVQFVKAYGEDLPFADGEFDIVFSVYLFHELPRSVREKVIAESKRVLKKGGVFAMCDSIQLNDDIILNEVLENFPKDYHEPFYKDYIKWDVVSALKDLGFNEVESQSRLLSKYLLAFN